ncbi:MAG: excinuclease ABC subunit UvrA [Verrucomicrobia bacterium]|nr:excinuclease ABC subunit UvrA [Verrucomicrobiota bacterium]
MPRRAVDPLIRLRGVRQNNLKGFDLDLPLQRLIVITGLSGSGKSSLAFDTLYAEGQRRYIETFSPYARQFFDRMDKPAVDSIEGIPPAIAIEQRNTVRTTRSTVGTMTEICDYLKALWPHVAQLHCRGCGQPVRKDAPQLVWKSVRDDGANPAGRGQTSKDSADRTRQREVLVTFDLPLSEKLSLAESFALIAKQGFQRLLWGNAVVRLEDALARLAPPAPRPSSLTVVQDRLTLTPSARARFIEACEQAYHFGQGKLVVWEFQPPAAVRHPRPFSNHLHCAACDLAYREPLPALFSFNHPVGACATCKGFGRVISIDYDLAMPDRTKSLAEGVVKPWQTGTGRECQRDLLRMCRAMAIPTDVPFHQLPSRWQEWVVNGDPDYGKDEEHEWPRCWYGMKGYFRWLESKAYKMHMRVLLSRYRAYTTCPDCRGARLKPEALLYLLPAGVGGRSRNSSSAGDSAAEAGAQQLSLADFYALTITNALQVVETLARKRAFKPGDPLTLVLDEVRSRLAYLEEVGVGYLTLDRPTRTLSGGETERVSLTTCLGTRLVNTLFVLDEPSVGLHPRDTARLVRILERLRDTGNTVVVVEHEPGVMRAADQIVDLGPGHGATGGQVVFQGSFRDIQRCRASLTGQYLSGRKRVEIPPLRPVSFRDPSVVEPANPGNIRSAKSQVCAVTTGGGDGDGPALIIRHATRHNLRDVTVRIPLERLVCLTGVSGSGKTTLVREILLPLLTAQLQSANPAALAPVRKASDRLDAPGPAAPADEALSAGQLGTATLEGAEHLARVVLVDQSSLGKTPRSNPAVYIGAFDDLREVFAQSDAARQRGLSASAFSFNSAQGQCERCRGAGFEKIEMQFLSDVFIRCPDCGGRRYREHILDVQIRSGEQESAASVPSASARRRKPPSAVREWSIADLLEATVEEAVEFLSGFTDSLPARRAVVRLRLLAEVGLGYLRLGQPINTLSGGESQRLKLVRHLAEAETMGPSKVRSAQGVRKTKAGQAGAASQRTPDIAPTLFLFDEPTTGLHFEDVSILLKVFQRLVDAGHSVLVIEHNLEVIKCADWVMDLGPEAGAGGGRLVAQGTPQDLAACSSSHTGQALRSLLG